MFQHIGDRLLGDAQEVLFHDFTQGRGLAQNLRLHFGGGAGGDMVGALAERLREVELLQFPAAQVPDRPAQLELTLPHPLPGQFQVRHRLLGIPGKKPRGGVELEADAGEGLLETVVQLLGQAGALPQHRLELEFGGFARRHLVAQLLGPLPDPPLQGEGPADHRRQREREHTDPDEETLGRKPTRSGQHPETGRRRQQDLQRFQPAVVIDFRQADAIDVHRTADVGAGDRGLLVVVPRAPPENSKPDSE